MEFPSHAISTLTSFKQLIWLFCYMFLLSSFVKSSSAALVTASSRNESDRSALLAIKSQIPSDPLGALSSWNHSLHHCDWQGIKCSRRHRERVTVLDLENKNLGGTLSPYIGNLSFLQEIWLTKNNFHGEIPQEIGRLFRLQFLYLNNNSFQGEIPSNITYCSNLRAINLIENNLSGSIFAGFSSLSKLFLLRLSRNNFIGKIPPSLGNLTSLTALFLLDNHLEGNIPNELCNVRSLGRFQVGINNLTGKIPSCLFNNSNIRFFGVILNQLEGNIPPNIGITLPILQEFYLGGNKFSGPIPVSLSNATRLENINIPYNAFTGSVPSDLGKLQELRTLMFDYNKLGTEGGDDLNFINSLTNCSKLEQLFIQHNVLLKGPLADSISNLSTTIRGLGLANSSIHGSIPVGIENLVNIQVISLSTNNLTGAIPTSIGKLNRLQKIDLAENLLSGHIPSSLGNLTQMTLLRLYDNHFTGRIPNTLGNLKNIAELQLSQNNLVGAIPIRVISFSSLTDSLDLSRNFLTGSLPSEVGNLTNLVSLLISDNKLSGHIPESLGKCLSLNELFMGGNFFEGEIPKSLITLKGLASLDISRNNLSGEIPEYLEQFPDLGYLNLSFNQLEGRVPRNGVFANASFVSVVGNHNLSGGIDGLKLQPCIQKKTKKKSSLSFKKVTIPIIVGSLCLIVLLLFFLAFYRRKLLNNNPSPSSTTLSNAPSYIRVSYLELHRATNGFSVDNLIGVGSYGSVFKGILKDINKTVALKVLNLEREEASKSFLTECNTLRQLRHRNILKIITTCSSVDFQGNDFRALVFEFMPYGSLEEWLHPRVDKQEHDSRNLSFIQRLNIAIDVASALDYLHHHCQPGVVHCDLKPSNVLLNEDMTARVADFGIAKMFAVASYDSAQSQPNSDVIRGSVGYVAPEYGMGVMVSMQGDVYSYGILLLEMFTRKRPTDDMFLNGLNLHHYAKMALPNQVMGIVDPLVLLEDNNEISKTVEQSKTRARLEECLVSAITIGITCSVEAPAERMTMSDVVSELLHIKKHYL